MESSVQAVARIPERNNFAHVHGHMGRQWNTMNKQYNLRKVYGKHIFSQEHRHTTETNDAFGVQSSVSFFSPQICHPFNL